MGSFLPRMAYSNRRLEGLQNAAGTFLVGEVLNDFERTLAHSQPQVRIVRKLSNGFCKGANVSTGVNKAVFAVPHYVSRSPDTGAVAYDDGQAARHGFIHNHSSGFGD